MFRSKTRQRRIFTNRRPVRRFSWLGAIASVGLFLLSLELLTRIFIDISGDRSQFAQVEATSDPLSAYQLNFVSPQAVERARKQDSLLAKSSMSVGYSLVENQQQELWQINEQGFRDRQAVPLVKPQGEVRIFLLGSSTAFGYGSPNNSSTISAQLESRLQQRLRQQQASPREYQPDLLPFDEVERQKYLAKPAQIKPGNYRIINAAVPGYASGNELAQIALQILQYQPDLIVVLHGYQDLLLPSTQKATPLPISKIASDSQLDSVGAYIDKLIEPLQNNSYLAQLAAKKWDKSQDDAKVDFLLDEKTSNLVKHLPSSESELQGRVNRYAEHQQQMLNLSAAAKVPLLIAMQPEITGRNPSQLTAAEGKIATELGRTYIKKVRADYPAFITAAQKLARAYPKNIKVIDLYKLTDKYPSPSFLDAIHLNEAANQRVAEQLYYGIASFTKMQVKPTIAPKPESSNVIKRSGLNR
ncbi:MAG: SGNH/GDSL hydrolase family protein [Cyanobacteria bacterium J06643_13]